MKVIRSTLREKVAVTIHYCRLPVCAIWLCTHTKHTAEGGGREPTGSDYDGYSDEKASHGEEKAPDGEVKEAKQFVIKEDHISPKELVLCISIVDMLSTRFQSF
jgi:hypothetical protein